MSKGPILEVRGLRVNRGDTRILENIHWRVGPGEHWVILGANGSGKTSLLNVLLAYLTPTAGEVSVMGSVFGETPWHELRTHIGLVSASLAQMMAPDEPALISVISGKDAIIDYIEEITPDERRTAMRILRDVEAGHLADRPWEVLSQGERQRILIGRALMARPKILILDEPSAGLDPVARETFLEFLGRLAAKRNAPTLVLVTHHVEEIPPCITHALLLKAGHALSQGSIDKTLTSKLLTEVFSRPATIRKLQGRYRLQIESRVGRAV